MDENVENDSIIMDEGAMIMDNNTYKYLWDDGKFIDRQGRPIGENIIKADVILSAWLNYCKESRIYRLLEFFGLR